MDGEIPLETHPEGPRSSLARSPDQGPPEKNMEKISRKTVEKSWKMGKCWEIFTISPLQNPIESPMNHLISSPVQKTKTAPIANG